MKTCRKVRPWLEWLAADEIDDRQRLRVEAHLRECASCRRELASWQSLLGAAADRGAVEAECRAIDWDTVSAKIMRKISDANGRHETPARRRVFSFAPLATAASLLLVIAAAMFFLTRPRPGIAPGTGNDELSAATVDRLQSGLAREEVISYLQQSQLMFSDLLKNCADEGTASWEVRLYSRQARKLLLQKKYFQQNLPALEWLRVRDVSERIDWLNYEILQLEDHRLCSQINRLQRIMENERLLLKIRLLEKDLSYRSFREV